MAKTEKTDCCWQGRGAAGTHTCWWENKMVQPLWTIVWRFLIKLIYIYPKTQRFLACIYTREVKISSHKKIYISIHRCFIHNNLRQTTNSDIHQPVNKQVLAWLYSGASLGEERNKLLTHRATWMHFKTLCWLKEASCEREHTIEFPFYGVTEIFIGFRLCQCMYLLKLIELCT